VRSAAKQALGRSRGGLSTKIAVVVSDENTVVALDVVPGQANDAPLLVPLLDKSLARVPDMQEIVGDKGFDGDRLREECLKRDVNPNIPLKSNRDPEAWTMDPQGYKERNRVERFFAKAKQFRRVATRYEKLRVTYRGLLHLVFGFIRLRSRITINTA
jgi:transposase